MLQQKTQGKDVTLKDLQTFVRGLPISEELKSHLLLITPSTYIGLAAELARM